jgi:TrpR-related protein YerC/YecD
MGRLDFIPADREGPGRLANVIARYYTMAAMKHRDLAHQKTKPAGPDAVAPLLDALLALRTPAEMRAFLDDLCTPAEIEAIADRWRVVPLLLKETPYREIHDLTGVSVTTIGRIARALAFGAGGYRVAADRVLTGRRRSQ